MLKPCWEFPVLLTWHYNAAQNFTIKFLGVIEEITLMLLFKFNLMLESNVNKKSKYRSKKKPKNSKSVKVLNLLIQVK